MRTFLFRGFTLWLAVAAGAMGADVSSLGSWMETIDRNDLTAGAGTDLQNQYESVSGTTTLNIASTAGGSWRIVVRRSDSTWHGHFTLYVRRMSDGSGSGSILGGSTYVPVSTLDTEIFTGVGDRSGIALQFKITGVSKDISPSLYSSGLIFTVITQ